MKLSIIIPVYNEEKTIEKIVDIVENISLPQGMEREIILVDDFSRDGTRKKLKKLKAKHKVYYHKVNQGKGAALRTGFQGAEGDIVLIQDADLEYDPHEYPLLLRPILEGKADVVFGSRFLGGKPHRILYYWHSMANRFLTWFSNMFSDLNLTDMETCYKVFKGEIIKNITIEEDRFGFEPEITAKIGALSRNQGIRIYEVGISYAGRTYEEGKKIGFKDALRAIYCIYKYNTSKFSIIVKYIINGTLVALSQFLIMIILVGGFGLNSKIGENVSNIISIEAAIIIAFLFHFYLTWRSKYSTRRDFVLKLINFHLVSAVSIVTRIVLFYFLFNLGLDYKLNTLIGILAAVLINFIGYDKLVFKNKEKIK